MIPIHKKDKVLEFLIWSYIQGQQNQQCKQLTQLCFMGQGGHSVGSCVNVEYLSVWQRIWSLTSQDIHPFSLMNKTEPL